MKNLKKKFRFRINLKSKHLLAIMTLFCLCCIVSTFASGITTAPLQETAGMIIVPFEKEHKCHWLYGALCEGQFSGQARI